MDKGVMMLLFYWVPQFIGGLIGFFIGYYVVNKQVKSVPTMQVVVKPFVYKGDD